MFVPSDLTPCLRLSWSSSERIRYRGKKMKKKKDAGKRFYNLHSFPLTSPDFGLNSHRPVRKERNGKVTEMLMLLFPMEK